MRIFAFALIWSLASGAAFALTPGEALDDPELEARARALSQELRCVVCDNESIDASNAPMAKDLRTLVRERIVAGDTDDEIKDRLVERYGTFVLLRPPVTPLTWALWFGPFVLAVGALGVLLFRHRLVRHLTEDGDDKILSAEEEAEITQLAARYGSAGPDGLAPGQTPSTPVPPKET